MMNITLDDDDGFSEEELIRTPERWKGLFDEFEAKQSFKFTMFDNPGYDQMIILRNIDFVSVCSHHLLPFTGLAHVGYVPQGRICGISKLARVVDKFASMPQVQERMTEQIADFLMTNLDPVGVMVVVEGGHECMRYRGVRKIGSSMVTSAIRGKFRDDRAMREEFLRLVK